MEIANIRYLDSSNQLEIEIFYLQTLEHQNLKSLRNFLEISNIPVISAVTAI